ncbi:MAG: DNA repair protein RecO [Fibrobacterota bacterium]
MRISAEALVLNTFSYGDSGLIFKCCSADLGLFSCIRRGAKKKAFVPQIGSYIAVHLYRRTEESGLFTLTEADEIRHFRFETSLLRTAARDTIYELVLRTMHEEEPDARIFLLLMKFSAYLPEADEDAAPFALWLFLVRYSALLGFAYSLTACCRCNAPLDSGVLAPEEGGFLCSSCRPGQKHAFSSAVLSLLARGAGDPPEICRNEPGKPALTRALTEFILYQLHSRADLKALDVFCSIL